MKKNNIKIVYADINDDKWKDNELSSLIYFTYNKELVNALINYKDYVDGVILISMFPCGPDSIVNDLLLRKIKDIPIVNLIIDETSNNAGIITRLESFIDIVNEDAAYE